MLLLLDKRTLRYYSNCFKVDSGSDSDFLEKDFIDRSNPKDYDAWVGIIHDEISLRKDLVFDDPRKLIGFVNLGSVSKIAWMIWSNACVLNKIPQLLHMKPHTCLFLWL